MLYDIHVIYHAYIPSDSMTIRIQICCWIGKKQTKIDSINTIIR